MLETRKRLLNDFEFYAQHAVKIRTKNGEIVPLVLNKVQRRLIARCIEQIEVTGRVRFVILKGRQQGASTCISAFIYWWVSQRKGMKAFVMAHVAESSQALYTMYERCHEHCPELLKPKTKFSNRKELVFDKLDSGIMVATAGGKGVGRSETIQAMHLSEVAFWPKTFAKDNFNGLIQTLPNVAGTMCFVESTANGVTGQFHDLWEGAVAGTNEFEPFFSAWFESDEYREPAPEGIEWTPDEEDLRKEFGLDDEQLYWRRRKIANNGIELFKQEYPCTAEEAFITSGRPVFLTETLVEWSKNVKPPIARMSVESGKVLDDPRGELLVYRKREDNGQYWIGADVAVGIKDPEKSDYCVAQILDSQMRQVAVWRGQVTPDHFARVLNALGYHYNVAMIAPERNGHGLLVCVRLWKDLNYPNCFTDLKEGALDDNETLNIGFQTNVSSKPLIIDKLRGFVREREIEINDPTTLSEMLSFVVTDSGKMEAEQGTYDDCVMSLAIAAHVHEGKWNTVDVTDDFYSTAI